MHRDNVKTSITQSNIKKVNANIVLNERIKAEFKKNNAVRDRYE